MITCKAIEAQANQILGHKLHRPGRRTPAPTTTALHPVEAIRIRRARESGGVHDDGGEVATRRCVLRVGTTRVTQEATRGRRGRSPPPPRTAPPQLSNLLAPAHSRRGRRLGVVGSFRIGEGNPLRPARPGAGRREGGCEGVQARRPNESISQGPSPRRPRPLRPHPPRTAARENHAPAEPWRRAKVASGAGKATGGYG